MPEHIEITARNLTCPPISRIISSQIGSFTTHISCSRNRITQRVIAILMPMRQATPITISPNHTITIRPRVTHTDIDNVRRNFNIIPRRTCIIYLNVISQETSNIHIVIASKKTIIPSNNKSPPRQFTGRRCSYCIERQYRHRHTNIRSTWNTQCFRSYVNFFIRKFRGVTLHWNWNLYASGPPRQRCSKCFNPQRFGRQITRNRCWESPYLTGISIKSSACHLIRTAS